jgi:hypothetical protein
MGASGVMQLGAAAAMKANARTLDPTRSPTNGSNGGICFAEDTPVLIFDEDTEGTVATADAPPQAPPSIVRRAMYIASGSLLVIGSLAAHVIRRRRKRRKRGDDAVGGPANLLAEPA